MANRKQLDPVNEILRNNVREDGQGAPEIGDEVKRMIKKTSKIHAGFLFDPDGKTALKQLCLRLCSSSSLHYEGWKGFSSSLGLSPIEIEYIDNHNNEHDQTYTALAVFVQERDSTLDKIMLALTNIKRPDIINIAGKLMEELSDKVIRRQTNTDVGDSGYFDSNDESEPGTQNVIMPTIIPSVPLALRKFRDSADVTSSVFTRVNNIVYTPDMENESLQTNAHISMNKRVQDEVTISTGRQQYKKTVMLTFANDGMQVAKEVAKMFRSEAENHHRIGVVILDEHATTVNSNPDAFITSCFDQVNYIIPIITKGYLKAISGSNAAHEENSLLCLDPKYLKYIYTLMNTNYLHDGCKNKKVRCIILDKLAYLTHQHPLMRTPLFQSWIKQSEIEQLKERIINAKI